MFFLTESLFRKKSIVCLHLSGNNLAGTSARPFFHRLVQADLGGGPSPVVAVIREALEDPGDEICTVTHPLTHSAAESPVAKGSYPAPSVFQRRSGKFVSPILQSLRQGFDQLAEFERRFGGGLEALQRAVSFGVFGILAHMPNRAREVLKQPGFAPLLLYFQGRERSTVFHTSHHTYNAVRQWIERLYAHHLRDCITDRVGQRPTAKRCEKFIRDEVEFPSDQDRNRERLLRAFQVYHTQFGVVEGLAEAVRDVYYGTLNATPFDFFRNLGRLVGFVRPEANRATRKYFTLEGVLLEAVLASLVGVDRVPFQTLLTLLHERYGLLTGGRPEDARVLLSHGFGQATVEDLRTNAQVFRQHLIDLGWGRQYADGLLYVQVPEGMR
jgi:hypothetical protein